MALRRKNSDISMQLAIHACYMLLYQLLHNTPSNMLKIGRSNYRFGRHRGHRIASEFHSLLHRTKSNYIGHSQYHIGPPKWAEQFL